MIDAVCVVLAMMLGGCVTVLGQWIIEDMGGMPKMPRRTKADEDKSKLEVAECTISEGSVELQKSYIESLSFWQHTSEFVEGELLKTKDATNKFRKEKSL
jgi:hypothetical protein